MEQHEHLDKKKSLQVVHILLASNFQSFQYLFILREFVLQKCLFSNLINEFLVQMYTLNVNTIPIKTITYSHKFVEKLLEKEKKKKTKWLCF